MASPQLDDGFTRIAHEILDEICKFKFNGSQLRIIIKVWRLTYGYNRKDHEFARTFLQEMTGLSESTVKQELSYLIKNKVLLLVQKETRSEGRKLSFNKNYEEWTIPKSGGSMAEQLDLFSEPEGYKSTPQDNEERGAQFHPSGGHDSTPLISVLGGTNPPPVIDSKSLKITFKDKEALFDQFYKIYPRRINKKKAEASWKRLCKEKDFNPDHVIIQTMNYAETCRRVGTETKYILHPTTFLNQKRYVDYDVIDPEGLAAASETKLDSNLDFLRGQLGGDAYGSETGRITNGEGFSGLPE